MMFMIALQFARVFKGSTDIYGGAYTNKPMRGHGIFVGSSVGLGTK
jgi:hypothetical protein